MPNCLSFFTGAGGLDIGLEHAGFHIPVACEKDIDARATLAANMPSLVVLGDVFSLDAAKVLNASGLEPRDVDLTISGSPCQSFSTAGKRLSLDDPRGVCLLKYLELVRDIRPKISVIENVRGFLSAEADGEPGGVAKLTRKLLEDMGYSVSIELYNTADYGVPQKRERVLVLAAREGFQLPVLSTTHADPCTISPLPPWRTLRDAIGDIQGAHHDYPGYSPKRAKWFSKISEGQNWKDMSPEDQKGAMGNAILSGGGKTGFFRRLSWDKPSPTLVTSPSQKATGLCHPVHIRPLSIQEYKRIQQFPDGWKLCGNLMSQYKQAGNAVPVGFGDAIGRAVMKSLSDFQH